DRLPAAAIRPSEMTITESRTGCAPVPSMSVAPVITIVGPAACACSAAHARHAVSSVLVIILVARVPIAGSGQHLFQWQRLAIDDLPFLHHSRDAADVLDVLQ